MRRLTLAVLLLSALCVLSGCTIYKTAVDERSVGTIVKDETISAKLQAKFLEDKTVSYLNISPLSYEGHVYLVGEYASAAERDRAVALRCTHMGFSSSSECIEAVLRELDDA